MSEVLDLDALVPQTLKVKIGDETFDVPPPSLQDILKLGALSQRMSKFDPDNMDVGAEMVAELTEQVYACAPALKGRNLNMAQLLGLVRALTELSTPPDIKELADQGISVDTGEKKTESE